MEPIIDYNLISQSEYLNTIIMYSIKNNRGDIFNELLEKKLLDKDWVEMAILFGSIHNSYSILEICKKEGFIDYFSHQIKESIIHISEQGNTESLNWWLNSGFLKKNHRKAYKYAIKYA